MATLREIIEHHGEDVLDAEVTFRVTDGHNNSERPHSMALRGRLTSRHKTTHCDELTLNIALDNHRLVRERGR